MIAEKADFFNAGMLSDPLAGMQNGAMRSIMLLLLFTLSSVEGLSPFASAHGDTSSLEAEVGEYLIDIGYEPALEAGVPIAFDADLFLAGPPLEYADFARVDIRVTKDGGEIVTHSVENEEQHIPAFTVTFPEAGDYDMDVRYLDANDVLLAARTFRLEVLTGSMVSLRSGLEALHYVIAAGLFALSIGIAGYSLWQRYREK